MGEERTIRILLAEDNPADVYLLRHALAMTGEAGVHLTVVTDGEAALDYVTANGGSPAQTPDLIVLDLNLPKTEGNDVLRAIRQTRRYAGVPIAILTSSNCSRDRESALRLGANSYLTKPHDLDEFLGLGAKLLALVRRREGRPAAAGK